MLSCAAWGETSNIIDKKYLCSFHPASALGKRDVFHCTQESLGLFFLPLLFTLYELAGPVDPHPQELVSGLPGHALLSHLRQGRHGLRREHRS